MTKKEIFMNHATKFKGEYIMTEPSSMVAMQEYAEQQVKNLNIPDVMQRSEQLFAFLDYCDTAGWIKNVDKKRIIEDYEKANNCV